MRDYTGITEQVLRDRKAIVEGTIARLQLEIAKYEEDLRVIAEDFKHFGMNFAETVQTKVEEVVEVVQDKVEEAVEVVKEEVKKAAPKRAAKKADPVVEEVAPEKEADSDK